MGDLLGFKGVIVNLVVRKVKKMVPAWSLPGAVAFNDALAAGRGMKLNKPKLDARRRRLPAVHRRHHRRLQGRDAAPPQHPRQRAAERRLAAAGAEEAAACRSALHRLRAAALSHLRADGVLPAGDARRRRQPADPEPARHAGLRQGADEIPGQQLPGGQHALQRAAEHARFRQARLLQAEDLDRRRHGGAEARSPRAG